MMAATLAVPLAHANIGLDWRTDTNGEIDKCLSHSRKDSNEL